MKTVLQQARLTLRSYWPQVLLALLLLSGFGLRMVDFSDPAIDFHPTRQYRGALIARGIYYRLSPSSDSELQQRALSMANSVAEFEPPILESLVAVGYVLAGEEQLWVARVLVSLFWVLGGVALYALVRRVVSPAAALIVLAYYLFLPFAVFASRSFQPDPVMVAGIAFTAYAAYRWSEERSWKWALIAAVSASISILVKAFAFYFVGGILLGVVFSRLGARQAWRERQVWVMAGVSLLPAALFYLVRSGGGAGNYVQNWIVALLPLAYDPGFYVRWLNFIGELFGFTVILAGLTGIMLSGGVYRGLLIGFWVGYVVYGITLPHQTLTHSYYHLSLALLLPLSIAPVLEVIVAAVATRAAFWRTAFALLVLGGATFNAWVARNTLVATDYRNEASYWESVGEALPESGSIIGLVQHYGHLLSYYGWRNVALWPVTGEVQLAELRGNVAEDFEADFLERTVGKDYFLVTTFNQLEKQTQLKEYLYSHFPVSLEGDGFILFDLRANQSGGS